MNFSGATLRPPSITFVDTPAMVQKFNGVPWNRKFLLEVEACDLIYHVLRAFNSFEVGKWPEGKLPAEVMDDIFHEADKEALHNAKNEADIEADKLALIETDNEALIVAQRAELRRARELYTRIGEVLKGENTTWWPKLKTDRRARYHDWSVEERQGLNRLRLPSSKPVVYVRGENVTTFRAVLDEALMGLDLRRLYIASEQLVFAWTVKVSRDWQRVCRSLCLGRHNCVRGAVSDQRHARRQCDIAFGHESTGRYAV